MTGQPENTNDRNEPPEEPDGTAGKRAASGVGPSTRELLHLLSSMDRKAPA